MRVKGLPNKERGRGRRGDAETRRRGEVELQNPSSAFCLLPPAFPGEMEE
ncbi:MAG: hypothetical protein F6K58_14345 [Symploca sp. SIO2E9]|nr:hypothetical protein [Symploca sp. SIO2E9]